MPVVTCHGVDLAYCWAGRPTGRVLVLSHSLGAAGRMWHDQVPELGQRFRLLMPDHRGHGNSGVPAGPYRIEQFGQDLLELLDHLHLEQVHFCGLSLGGMIGMWMGQHAPDRIGRLVLCNTAAKIQDPSLLRSRIEHIEQEGLAAIAENVIDRWFTSRFRASHPEAVEAARLMLLATPASGYANTSQAVCDLDLRDGLQSVPSPTLVIAGEHDLATPVQWNREVAAAIPHARFEILAAAHLSNIEAQDEFNRVVLDFLAA